jgi:hypothetical protein
VTRRPDAIRIAQHLAKTREDTRREFNTALEIIFLGLRGSRPALSRAEDDYGIIERERETIKKTLLAEVARHFDKRRGRPRSPGGHFTDEYIKREMARLTAKRVGINKAAEEVHKLLVSQQVNKYKALRRRFPKDRQILERLPKPPTAYAIAMRWRRMLARVE